MNTRKFSGDMADQVDQDREELIRIKDVLQWSSENVWICQRFPQDGWVAHVGSGKPIAKPTLYEALHTAWEKRDE